MCDTVLDAAVVSMANPENSRWEWAAELRRSHLCATALRNERERCWKACGDRGGVITKQREVFHSFFRRHEVGRIVCCSDLLLYNSSLNVAWVVSGHISCVTAAFRNSASWFCKSTLRFNFSFVLKTSVWYCRIVNRLWALKLRH